MEYKIVSHKTPTETEDEVNTLIDDGWALHGELKVSASAYVQAMVKHGDYEGGNFVNVYLQNQDDIEYAIKSIGDALETVAKALSSDKPSK